MKKPLLIGLLLFTLCNMTYSQEDAEGCKDHPMFNRMPKYVIAECVVNFDQVQIMMADGNEIPIDGNKTFVYYTPKEDYQQPPSFFAIVKNYENAISKYGGKKIYYSTDRATLKLKSGNKDIWLSLNNHESTNGQGCYDITILEVEEMVQDILATQILDALNKEGHIALYINFETGKSDIKPDSQKTIDQIAEMLKGNPSLKISVEGHTDNVGTPASNKTLSESRAKSVIQTLIAKGIDKSRLSAKGWGQEKPVFDNNTEDGRAKNRRVEIVKL